MLEIKQIYYDGSLYAFKDETARNDISTNTANITKINTLLGTDYYTRTGANNRFVLKSDLDACIGEYILSDIGSTLLNKLYATKSEVSDISTDLYTDYYNIEAIDEKFEDVSTLLLALYSMLNNLLSKGTTETSTNYQILFLEEEGIDALTKDNTIEGVIYMGLEALDTENVTVELTDNTVTVSNVILTDNTVTINGVIPTLTNNIITI